MEEKPPAPVAAWIWVSPRTRAFILKEVSSFESYWLESLLGNTTLKNLNLSNFVIRASGAESRPRPFQTTQLYKI